MPRLLKRTTIVLGLILTMMLPGVAATASSTATRPAPAAAAAAVNTWLIGTPVSAGSGLYWFPCTIPSQRTNIIILAVPFGGHPVNDDINCTLSGEHGFAALITNSSTSRTVKVCNHTSVSFWEGVNVANASGGATGEIRWYEDTPGGGCYVTNISYPVRKFYAYWAGTGSYSPWAPPY